MIIHNTRCEQMETLHTEGEQSVFESPHLRLDYYCKHAITRVDLCDLMSQCKPRCLHFGGHGQLEDFGHEFVDALPFHSPITGQADAQVGTIKRRRRRGGLVQQTDLIPSFHRHHHHHYHCASSQVFDTVKPHEFLEMLYPHIWPRGPIELVVLNSCKGEGLARLLQEEAHVPYVVYWKTKVRVGS